MLVTAATDLQKDIVESGRVGLGGRNGGYSRTFYKLPTKVSSLQGAGSVKEFYAKNSCWTEGLISASKTVGWGATQMV